MKISENYRKAEISKRLRLLNGTYSTDIKSYINTELSTIRAVEWGSPDCSRNPFKQIWESVSGLYSEAPIITGPIEVITALEEIGYWNKMKRMQRDTLALNEMLVYFGVVDGKLYSKPISGALVEAKFSPTNSYDIRRIKLSAQFNDVDVQIIYDADEEYVIAITDSGEDITEKMLGKMDNYPYKIDDKAYVPFVIYRAADTGEDWNTFEGSDIVEATYRLALLYTYFGHCVKNAAWAQRYAVNISIPGAEVEDITGTEPINKIIADPATVAIFNSSTEGVQPQIGQFSAPVDLKGLMESIQTYEDRIYSSVVGQSVMRSSADIRSGYSLAVSREERISLQKGYLPTFKYSDKKALQLCGWLLGIQTELSDWEIIYPSLINNIEVK